MDHRGLGEFLRSRREVMQPEDIGIRRGPRRRTSGLRREEVASLADVSSDYLARLERGDGSQPSTQVLGALARALRLTRDERDHILLLAGHQPPTRAGADDHVSPGLLRILDSLADTPAQVMGPIGETLAQNSAAVALFGNETQYSGPARSAVYRWFTDPQTRSLYRGEDRAHQSRVLVAQLRSAAARHATSAASDLVERLRTTNDEFEQLWNAGEIGLRNSEEKHFEHPEVGTIDLYCQTALDADTGQTLLVLTATPGTDSAQRLRLLAVLGTYDL